ncbi:MAG: phosphoribose diphosphate--decaprenyl-phosphate phosphoribosyltransferase [Chloroflexi bacterium RBG_13_68_17]|nr:MAG: phosphoribose diphosphate--decaprenyl-phosphate phosphoribosyltransferase [Chloroflexi bacterium RBG_13_68_17]
MLRQILKTMRPRQWAKNGFLFAALVFDRQLLSPLPLLRTVAGFGLMCLASGLVYVINDLVDLPNDRQHPTKRLRPLAAGSLAPRSAVGAAIVLSVVTLAGSFGLGLRFGLIVLTYVASNLLYSFWLKHVPIIDVLLVASGFVLRVGAGVVLLTVERFSPWLYVCMTLLALFLGFGKRRAELVLLADGANSHRRVLDGYTIPLLDQLIVIVSATTLMAYSLYTFSAINLPANHTMMLTIPFVVYAIFHYLHLIHVEGAGGAPEELLLTDRPLLATIFLWGLAVVAILYLGQ